MIKRIALFVSMLVASIALGQIPITQLPPAQLPLTGAEQVPLVQSGHTRQATVNSIQATSAPNSNPFILQSAGTGVPNARILAGTASQISLTDGGPGGTLTLSFPNNVSINTLTLTNPLTVPSGGTGVATLTGLALGHGAAAFSAYPGTSCTNQFPRSLNTNGVATCNSVALGSDVSGILLPVNGGTGINGYTLGDTLYASNSTTLTKLAGNITTTNKFLTQVGSGAVSAAPAWNTIQSSDLPGGFTGFANPTASVGLTPVNGAATTAMRSDAAPQLSQAISPTWTGNHTFTPASGVGAAFNGTSNNSPAVFSAFNGLGVSKGPTIVAGTNASDFAIQISNRSSTATFLQINGDGSGELGEASASGLLWTAGGAFSVTAPTSGVALTTTAVANQYSQKAVGSSTSGQSFGEQILAGTTSADQALTVSNQGNTTTFMQIFGDGHGGLGPNTTNNLIWDTAGHWTFNAPSAGGASAFTFTGRNGNNAINITQGAGAGTAFGLAIVAGTNSSDYGLQVTNQANTTQYFQVRGDGAINGFGQTSGTLLRMDPDTSQPTLTITGCTTAPTGTGVFTKIGHVVIVVIPTITCTSNATTLTLTGIPANFQAVRSQQIALATNTVQNNSATITNASISVTNSNVITFLLGGSNTGWTNVGTKGPNTAITAMWTLD